MSRGAHVGGISLPRMSRPAPRSRATSSRPSAPPSADGFKTVRAAVDAKSFAPVYYLHGDDDYLKEQSLQELLDAALDPSTRDFNCEVRDGAALDAEAVGSLLGTPPMLAERRAVVVRDVHTLKKAARQQLDRYLRTPASDTLVVLITPAGQAVDAALAHDALPCAFEPLAPDRVRRWIAHHSTTMLGVSVTDDAAALLQQSVGNDLQQLASELDKCASYARGAQGTRGSTGAGMAIPDPAAPIPVVDDAAVSAVVGVRRGETPVDLLDAIALRESAKALALVPFVLSQPKMGAVPLVMMLSTQTLALRWGRAKRDGGWGAGQLEREYFTYLKQTGGGMVGRPWGEAKTVWTRAVDKWTAAELRQALRLIRDADIALKDTKISNEEQIMLTLVLALAKPARGRAA
jgi:DNA polymerase III subunit delta